MEYNCKICGAPIDVNRHYHRGNMCQKCEDKE